MHRLRDDQERSEQGIASAQFYLSVMHRDQLRAHMTAAQIEQTYDLVKRRKESRFKQCDYVHDN